MNVEVSNDRKYDSADCSDQASGRGEAVKLGDTTKLPSAHVYELTTPRPSSGRSCTWIADF
jgi:hypothetical protein